MGVSAQGKAPLSFRDWPSPLNPAALIADTVSMFDFSTSSLLAGLLVSSLGAGIFLYGKATKKFMPLAVGGAMSIYPFFITAAWMMFSLTAALCVVLYMYREQG